MTATTGILPPGPSPEGSSEALPAATDLAASALGVLGALAAPATLPRHTAPFYVASVRHHTR